MTVKQKIKLPFMVDPDQLKKWAEVEAGVGVIITDSSHELYKPYLGASGKLLANAGFTFYFEPALVKRLIDASVAKRV